MSLNAIKNENPDLIVHTGDFCFKEPQEEIYQWLKEQIDQQLDKSILRYLPGNHDYTPWLIKHFGIEHLLQSVQNELFHFENFDGTSILYLDSSNGFLSTGQLIWIKMQLDHISQENIIIFMHHPPMIMNVPYMDQNHALKNGVELIDILYSFPNKTFNIYTGHYHVEKEVVMRNVKVSITPSGFFQIDPNSEEFKVGDFRIGYRTIELNINEEGETSIVSNRVSYI